MARDKDDITSQKQLTLRRLFEDDWMLIHVDTRSAGINVPDNVKNSPSVTFKLSHLFQGATEIGNTDVTAQLLFGDSRYACVFPFDAIWGATSFKGSNIVWPESAPPEVLAQIEKNPVAATAVKDDANQPSAEVKKLPNRGNHLRRVK